MNKYKLSRKDLAYTIDVWLGEQPERMKEYFDVNFAKQLRKDLLSKKEPKEMWSHQMSGNRVVGFKCNMCGMVGKTLNNLEKHMLAKHLPKPESDKESEPVVDEISIFAFAVDRCLVCGKKHKNYLPNKCFDILTKGVKLPKSESDKECEHPMTSRVWTIDGNACDKCGTMQKDFEPQPESDKERCLHDHLCCPGDIRTVRCAYCGKSMYHEPQEELEVKPLKKIYFYSNEPMTDREEFVARGQEKHHDKIQELIKAHNALVKEVKGQNSEPTNVIKPHEAYCRKCLLWKEINKDGYCFNCLLTLSK